MLKQCSSPSEIDTDEPTQRSGILAVVAGLEDKQQEPEQDQEPEQPEEEQQPENAVQKTEPASPSQEEPTSMTTATSPPPPPPETEQPGQQQPHGDSAVDSPAPASAVMKDEQPESTSTITEELGSRLVCAVCDAVLASEAALAAHIQELGLNHIGGGDEVQGFACRVCRRAFDSADLLDRHVQSHPGEQVFKCPLCGQALRTNGGLARHLRGHLDGHVDLLRLSQAAKRRLPDNHVDDSDYEVEAKRRSPSSAASDEEVAPAPQPAPLAPAPTVHLFTCPVCPPSQPFRVQYLPELEAHLEQCHRDYSVTCELCSESFRSVRALNLHVHSVHRSGGKAGRVRDVYGFKDLTFVDFTSQKFAHIARAECEKSLHRATSRLHPFQCECGLAFPCDSALAIHRQACPNTVYVDSPADLSRNGVVPVRRPGTGSDLVPPRAASPKGDFFAKLDLLNNASTSPSLSAPPPAYMDRDLADIQSIQSILNVSATSGLGHDHVDERGEEHEEQQDAFAAEFRRMKQRGEFPCRLCPEVFPNLRALKGHNRAHMAAPGADGYRCNMCPHSALDKVALQRHMRTHNGARPYECALCRFAFTTKANCERHLRNRHAKCSRDEVKSSIIYHPSEDPGNDPEQQQQLQQQLQHVKLDVKRSLFAEPSEQTMLLDEDARRRRSLDVGTMTSTSEDEREEPVDVDEQDMPESGRQSPLDLSMVLDLSKKRPPSPMDDGQENDEIVPDEDEEMEDEDQPQDLSRKSSSESCSAAAPTTLPLHLNNQSTPLQSPEPAAPAAALPFPGLNPLYVSPYQLTPPAQVPGLPPGLAPGLPFPAAYYPGLLRSLQLGQLPQLGPLGPSGLVLEPMRLLQRPPFLTATESPVASSGLIPDHKDDSGVACPAASPKSERSSASDSHHQQQQQPSILSSGSSSNGSSSSKMVMKNGVLMPKQKQRRYRTERPFLCDHCDARFTLSSNRERHVKHQHPQFWKDKHRGPSTPASLKAGTPPSTPAPAPVDASTPLRATLISATTPRKIEEDDEDEGLVIDEERPSSEEHHVDDDGVEGDAEDEGHQVKVQSSAAPGEDLASVSRLLDNASMQTFRHFLRDGDEQTATLRLPLPHPATPTGPAHSPAVPALGAHHEEGLGMGLASEEDMDEEGLVAGSPSEGNNSGSEQDKSECESAAVPQKKKSAYSLAPNRVCCPYCSRKFPWTSSLRRHVLTHTGQKPYKCTFCPLLFTTKSNCDRHLARKHSNKKDANSSSSSGVSTNSGTPNSSTASVSPGSSAGSGSPPEVLSVRAAALSPPPAGPGTPGHGYTIRPYRCRHCPSSTFASLSNLRKHVFTKHSGASLESCILPSDDLGRANLSGYESHGSVSDVEHPEHGDEKVEDKKMEMKVPLFSSSLEQPLSLCKVERNYVDVKEEPALNLRRSSEPGQERAVVSGADIMREAHNTMMSAANLTVPITAPVVSIPEGTTRTSESSVTLSSSELPFKCHLCDGSFTERQECLDHIRLNHSSEYDLLLSKGQLELNVSTSPEENNNAMDENHHADGENIEHIRGKFPDYANRKVMCAFCMRRFWSAEDLRRHMRTHTGERPFSCDVCRRRFTLKHSMLRHRKKHTDSSNNSINAPVANSTGPEDLSPSATSGDEEGLHGPFPANFHMHHVQLINHNNNNILISNLLGINEAVIDQMLISKSADDAEKLLGVSKHGNRSSNGRT
ncbi:ras-responsive element-binding protein 1 isoform X1 [Frankliniella occidentalis]|uniref:Ras-responsive element-binding protein 1 isoform X1 n=2 Tax=Frankliniella occidentalis TaxID=133901 RepID=A0A6J1RUH6_FRAOC|nr:ras-responsive element-binding protein 1 isoform X1 [Frankliniella occidentalis]